MEDQTYTSGVPMSLTMIQSRTDRRSKRAELPEEIAKRLKSCSVLNCEEWRDLTAYTTYHCFPNGEKNQERWEIWTQLLRKSREDVTWIPFRGSLVCSHHFRSQDFVNDPMSKRRKLMKNAIPSIFPSFTVDLEDPSYSLTGGDDGNEDESYENGDSEDNNNNGDTSFGADDSYEYDYPIDQNTNAEDEEDADIQIISGPEAPSPNNNNRSYLIGNRRADLSSHETGKLHIVSTASIAPPQQQHKILSISSSNMITSLINNGNKIYTTTALQSRSVMSSTSNFRNQQRAIPVSPVKNQRPPKLTRQQETVNALNALPFNLNPDLEIDVIDPAEDLAAYRLRISELEQQNKYLVDTYKNALEELKHNYEHQIMVLRKRLQDRDNLLALHQISPSKKVRLL